MQTEREREKVEREKVERESIEREREREERSLGVYMKCFTESVLGCSVFAGWAVFEMVLPKAVVFASIVTQKNIVFFAVPHCLMSLLLL